VSFSKSNLVRLAVLLLLLIAMATWFYRTQEQVVRQQTLNRLETIAHAKAEQITQWRQARIAEGELLMSDARFTESIVRRIRCGPLPDDPGQRHILEKFHSVQAITQCKDEIITDPNGRVLFSLSGQTGWELPGSAPELAAAFQSGQAVMTDLRPQTNGWELAAVVVPLYGDPAATNQPVGTVMMVYDSSQYFGMGTPSWMLLSQSAEYLLVRREEANARILSQPRPGETNLDKMTLSLKQNHLVEIDAVLRGQGMKVGPDAHGRSVLAVAVPLPGQPWTLIAKLDADEALRAWRFRAAIIFGSFLVLLGALGATVGIIRLLRGKYEDLARMTEVLLQSEQQGQLRSRDLALLNASLQQEIADRHRLETKLAHEHQLQRTLIDLLPDGIYLKDRDSRFLLLNQPLARRLGKQEVAEVIGLCDHDLFPPEAANAFRKEEERILAGEKVREKEELIFFPNGEQRTVLTTKVPFRDPQGNITGIMGMGRDITEHKLADARLRESEERFRKLFEDSAEAILMIENGRFVNGNRAALGMLGMESIEQLRNRLPARLSPRLQPDGQPSESRLEELMAKCLEQGSCAFEWEHLRLTAEPFMVEVLMTAIEYRNKKMLHVVWRDITRQKQTEKLRTQLSTILESTSDFVATASPRGKVLYFNRAARQMFGLSEGDDPATITIARSHPAWAARLVLEVGIPTAMQEGVWTGETAFLDRYGREVPHTQVIMAHKAADGTVELLSTVAHDISAQKKAGDLLKSRLRLMQAAHAHTRAEFLQIALDEIEASTGSSLGYYHFMGADQQTVSLQSWSSKTTQTLGRLAGAGRRYPVGEAGVWCDCVRLRQPVVHNDYDSLAHCQGLPEGHAPILRLASVPVFRNDRIVAIIGVGNKPTAYTDADLELITLLGDFSWEVVERLEAEEALRTEQNLFRLLMDNAHDRVYFKDLAGRFLRVNQSKLQLHGLTEMSQILGKTDFDLGLGEQARLARLDEEEIIRTGKPVINREAWGEQADGAKYWFTTNKAPLRDSAGNIVGIFGISHDITARKQMEEQLRDTAQRLQMLWQSVENSPATVVITDTRGNIQYVNPKFVETTGYTREEAVGRNPRVLKSGQMSPVTYKQLWQTIAAGENWHGEFLNRRKDGSFFWESAIITPVKNEQGKVVNFLAIKEDITERKAAAEALQQSLSLQQATLESTTDGILVVSLEGRITSCNQQFVKLWNVSRELMASDEHPPVLRHVASQMKDPAAFTARVAELYQDPSRDGFDVLEPLDGRIVERYARTQWLQSKAVGRVWSFRDVTRQYQAETATKKLLAELSRSNTELEQFAYVASHDLQEPLRLVSSYTQLLLQRYGNKLDADAVPLVGFITEGVTRMERLIQDLLTYSRVSSQTRVPKKVAGEALLQLVLQNLSLAIREQQATVTHDPLPELLGDETLLLQLFQNLIANAIKFHREGVPAHVHVGCRLDEAQAAWRFSVRDNGIGIEPAFYERIFVIFQRLHSRRKYSGTGIGLTICKRIVERHGGRIWVESEPGCGTTFHFTLALQPTMNPNQP